MKTNLLTLHILLMLSVVTGCQKQEPSRVPDHSAQPASPPVAVTPTMPPEARADQQASGRTGPAQQVSISEAHREECFSNLKQISLAARIWSESHKDHLPSSFTELHELMPIERLLCPDDSQRLQQAPTSWAAFAGTNVSYTIEQPGIAEKLQAEVYANCSYHGYVLYVSGHVAPHRQ